MFEKIKAAYDYDCVWNEWENITGLYDKHKGGSDEYILGKKMEVDGVRYVKNELHGCNDAIDEVIKLQAEIKRLKDALEEIEAVACGEEQIQCDGAYNDSDGLQWIYKRIQALESGGEVND